MSQPFFRGKHGGAGLLQTPRLAPREPSRGGQVNVGRKARGAPTGLGLLQLRAGQGQRCGPAGAPGSGCQGEAEGEERKGEVGHWHLGLLFAFVSSSLPCHCSRGSRRKCRHPETPPSKRHKYTKKALFLQVGMKEKEHRADPPPPPPLAASCLPSLGPDPRFTTFAPLSNVRRNKTRQLSYGPSPGKPHLG